MWLPMVGFFFFQAEDGIRDLTVTGVQTCALPISREVSEAMGRLLGKKPNFCGTELETSCLGNAAKAHQLFGLPKVSAGQLIEWVANWVKRGGENLGKPTHFEVRDGRY